MAQNFIASIQLRRDTKANWEKINPVLKDGEFVIITDTSEYKVGDGVTKFNALPVKGYPAVQDKGTSTSNVMSQKAVTDELNRLDINKFEKSNVSSQYPSVEPSDDTSVISAKQQFKKDKEQADKIAQLEQDVNVVRGDVQGVYGLKSEASSRKGISLGDSFAFEVWFKCAPGMDNISEYYFNGNSINDSFIIYTGNSNTNKLTGFAYNSSGSFASLLSYDDTTFTNKYTHIAMAYDGNILQCAVNGVLKEITFPDLRKPANRGLWIEGKAQVSVMRSYNISKFTQQQIDFLYNQGRCDELKLSEFYYIDRGVINPVPKDFPDKVNFSPATNENGFFSLSASQAIDKECRYITTFNFKKYDGTIPSKIDLYTTYHFACEQFSYDNTTGNVSYLLKHNTAGITLFYPVNLESNTVYNITNFRCCRINVLNEYLPQYLTQTKWIDNGVSKQDIALNATQFTYIRPYKQYSFGSGAPTVIPDAAHTEYTDVATGNVWKCGGKPNTRQFAVSDWKQINN